MKEHHSALKKYGMMKTKRMAATISNMEQVYCTIFLPDSMSELSLVIFYVTNLLLEWIPEICLRQYRDMFKFSSDIFSETEITSHFPP